MDEYKNKIIEGNCVTVMREFKENSIDLTLTSPPYDNLRAYKGYVFPFNAIVKEFVSYKDYKIGDLINLERAMILGARLDGHIVQGHVDTTGKCVEIIEMDGSTEYVFEYDYDDVTVSKGSITINGVSLTVVQSDHKRFSVHIIPYTTEHTNFHQFKVGTIVNLEFDIIGKYVRKMMEGHLSK